MKEGVLINKCTRKIAVLGVKIRMNELFSFGLKLSIFNPFVHTSQSSQIGTQK